ncbi:MAG: phosphoesterase, partial [Mariprofundus sp.]|nr:phosphoesterase [Mariprofundus sp.]
MQNDTATHTLFRLINDAHTPLGDLFFGTVTGLGDGLVIALLCSLLMLFRLRLGIASVLAYLISGLLAQIL